MVERVRLSWATERQVRPNSRPTEFIMRNDRSRIRTRELNENSDGDFEFEAELGQPPGDWAVLIAA